MNRRMTAAEREEARAAFLKEAAARWDGMFEPSRQGDLRTFDQREARAVEIAHALGAKVLEEHVRRDAEGPVAPTVPCPRCGRNAELRPATEDQPTRAVQTRVGEIGFGRPEYYCGRCRRSFFPGGPGARAGNGGV